MTENQKERDEKMLRLCGYGMLFVIGYWIGTNWEEIESCPDL